MPESKLITPQRIVYSMRLRADSAVASANFFLKRLVENRIDWLATSYALDGLRRDIRSAALVLSDLVAPAEHAEIQTILAETLQQIDAIGAKATKDYLLNGPKAVAA